MRASRIRKLMRVANRIANSELELTDIGTPSHYIIANAPGSIHIASGIDAFYEVAQELYEDVSGIRIVERASEEYPQEKSFTYVNDHGNCIRCFSLLRGIK